MTKDWREPLKFEEREIHSYVEYAKPADLKVGSVYFRVSFLDKKMHVPELTPLVFVGRDLGFESEPSHRLYFQDAVSYLAGIRWDDPAPEPREDETEEERFERFLSGIHLESFDESKGVVAGVLEFEKALNQLMLCSLSRRGLVP